MTQSMGSKLELTGEKHGRLTVIQRANPPYTKHYASRWECVCDCGRIIVVIGRDLRSGHTKSCGCLTKERFLKHGRSRKNGEPYYLFGIWKKMVDRCYNPSARNWKNYGGRGISVYYRWVCSPADFIDYITNTIGDRPTPLHSLDRINNDGSYEPGNLRWATARQQNRNRRIRDVGSDNDILIAMMSLPN